MFAGTQGATGDSVRAQTGDGAESDGGQWTLFMLAKDESMKLMVLVELACVHYVQGTALYETRGSRSVRNTLQQH